MQDDDIGQKQEEAGGFMSDKCEHKTLIGFVDGGSLQCADCDMSLYDINCEKVESLERKVEKLEADKKDLWASLAGAHSTLEDQMDCFDESAIRYEIEVVLDRHYEELMGEPCPNPILPELQAKAIEEVNYFRNSVLMFLAQEHNKAFNSGKLPECHSQLTAMRNLINQCFAEYAASKRSSD